MRKAIGVVLLLWGFLLAVSTIVQGISGAMTVGWLALSASLAFLILIGGYRMVKI